ncbi:hypothetical protein [Prosthecomicrobium pneumaticum]|uniref:DUF1344 domain-containing protein n=1 Tax=Prosthecomicrobium pneumaticum TaxID=81895 RepID=A0A7W9FJU5_9HYPH|nr:hypothetical protein [Prosthecomicrobium pneumaticum]MBB5752097.1 hypothetical protein [Prosthecomicrobium pneumaticum]
MKTLALATASVAFLAAAAGSALAAQQADGTVGSVTANTITFTNGQSFRLEHPNEALGFIPGDTVSVGYQNENGHPVALGVVRRPDPTKSSG